MNSIIELTNLGENNNFFFLLLVPTLWISGLAEYSSGISHRAVRVLFLFYPAAWWAGRLVAWARGSDPVLVSERASAFGQRPQTHKCGAATIATQSYGFSLR